ncbi:MAG: PD-(D/E)XK nuclease family protein [Acidimicrobiia bacterium]|nr:PD-(D/E)XK nuclease family protein [Acidimicrobiia bacterium]
MELTPAQAEVLDVLAARPDERPDFDPELRHLLRHELEQVVAPLTDSLPDTLFVSKHALSSVLECEASHLADQAEPFTWSPPLAVGSITHRAIELGLAWKGEPSAGERVEEALSRAAEEDSSLGDWLRTIGDADRADIVGRAVERLAAFDDTFPPLDRRWRPVAESRLRVELANGAVVLSGKVDLTLGRADGTRAGKVLVDFKTGTRRPQHLDDLRFYAVLETIRVGTPPRMSATHYLDQGTVVAEPVTTEVLRAGLHRTVAATVRLAELAAETRQAQRSAGPRCRWCALSRSCDDGQRWLEESDAR